MKVAVSNSRRISRRGEGRRVRGGGPGAGELGPQPAPGEMAAGPGLPCTAGSREAAEKQENGLPPPEDKSASHQPWEFHTVC
ncbi:uncharacterized protein AAG666_009146 isoform 3-T4 [Megaptera novaeangliae]